MTKPWILILALLVALPAVVCAQGGKGGKSGKGGGTVNGATTKPAKPIDLAAGSITAKWKDAKTLRITVVVRNTTSKHYSGVRTASLIVTGKDGKPETVVSEALLTIDASASHSFDFETTDKKFFEKDLKWTVEISAGDEVVSNDKKTTTLNPGPPPKAP